MTPTRFNITWRKGAYYVSIPNYEGGEVMRGDVADKLVAALEAANKLLWQECYTTAHPVVAQIEEALTLAGSPQSVENMKALAEARRS